MKRGLSYAEAMAYVGVKRRTFEAIWRPRLVGMPQGVTVIFDKQELDRLFDELKTEAQGMAAQATNAAQHTTAHNPTRNRRQRTKKGAETWAKQQGESTPMAALGKSTNYGKAPDFASAVLEVLQKQSVG